MANRRLVRNRACAQCGISPIAGYKFCSAKCRTEKRDRDAGVQSWRERYPEHSLKTRERICETCGGKFSRRRRPDDAARFCSRECGLKAKRRLGEISRKITAEKKLYAMWARRAKARLKRAASMPKPVKLCRDCGVKVEKGAQRCEPCKEIAKQESRQRARARQKTDPKYKAWRRASKSASKARRRARRKAATIETFDPIEILSRDGWRCHLCGIKTPRRLRGTFEDNAPELDHVVPLAAGGEHSRKNTACCCRKCNIEKADKPLGQLRLVA